MGLRTIVVAGEAMAEFMRLRERLEQEMDERFDSQDEIIDSLS